jgi:hypothetical protein
MGWSAYKSLCDSPRTLSRWMIEQSLELLCDEPLLADALGRVLRSAPLDKPADHRGGPASDMFELDIDTEAARRIHDVVAAAVREGRATSATQQRGLGGFAEAWLEYLRDAERRRDGPAC